VAMEQRVFFPRMRTKLRRTCPSVMRFVGRRPPLASCELRFASLGRLITASHVLCVAFSLSRPNGLALTRGACFTTVQTSTVLLRRRRVQRLLGRAPVPRRIPPFCSMTAAINGFT